MPFDKQDYTIAQHVAEGGVWLLPLTNGNSIKEKPRTLRMIQAKVEASLAQVGGVAIVPISALKGDGLTALMNAVTKPRNME
jgi:predicted GTPase